MFSIMGRGSLTLQGLQDWGVELPLTRVPPPSFQGGLIALLLLLLVFTVALYAQRRWYKQRRIPQKSASTEATHEIHYIPSVLLGSQGRESFRNSRLQAHNSVIGIPIRETPILDDYDYEEEENPLRPEHACREDEFGSQVMEPLGSLGRSREKLEYDKKGWWFVVSCVPLLEAKPALECARRAISK